MSLMPDLHDDKNYKILREKLDGGKFEAEQTFRVEHNIRTPSNSRSDSAEKICIIDAFSSRKFGFDAKFGCSNFGCNYMWWPEHPEKCGQCGNSGATVTISLSNLGVEVQAEFDIGIEKIDKSITRISKETKKSWKNDQFLKTCYVFSFGENSRNLVGPDGAVTFVLTIKNIEPAVVLPIQPEEPGVDVKLAEEFSETCLNTIAPPDPLVDVTLYVEGKKIYGHKLILSLTSKYFRRMFESNMKEANRSEVHLDDIDFTTLQSLLQFMYSNSIDEDKITLDLLEAADRFEVMRLIKVCCQKLSKTINLKNVAKIWETSYKHSIEDLTHDCVLFMAKEWKLLAKDDQIHELAKKYSELPMTIASLLTERNN